MTTVAIDFGTSNTVVSILESDTNTPKTLRFPAISRLFRIKKRGETWDVPVVPTVLFVKDSQDLFLGNQVKLKRLGMTQPHRFFKTFKRDLAAEFQALPRQLDGVLYTPELVSELFIVEIWKEIQKLSIKPSQVVFTVPVGAFERYLDWFRELGNSLGVAEVQLVDESTAAALGYAVKRPGSLVLVVDFGGGTLDLSLIRTIAKRENNQELRAEVLAKSDAYIGGEDVDIWIVEDYLHQLNSSRKQIGEIGWQNLLEIAEKLKIRLSKEDTVKETWFDDEAFMSYKLKLTRDKLETILEKRGFLEQLRNSLDEVLNIALGKGINKSGIEQVLLVGGSCLIPVVQQLIISYFGRGKVKLDQPFEAVCHGALALTQIVEIDDYLRHSYAIRLWEPNKKSYSYLTLFEKGMQYPCQRKEVLTLQVAHKGQREIRLDIGELAEVSQVEVSYDQLGRMTSSELNKQTAYRSLESEHQQICVAHLEPPGEIGIDRISVQFEVNEKRFLLATVRDLLTGNLLVERGAIAKLK